MPDSLWEQFINNTKINCDRAQVLTDGEGDIFIVFFDKDAEVIRITVGEEVAKSLKADLDWAIANQKEK